MTRSVGFFGTIAIPVGHRVEVYVLARDVGLFGSNVQKAADEPMVRDLDTGIHYGRHWHFGGPDGKEASAMDTTPRVPHPPAGVTVAERFSGRVVNCIVWTDGRVKEYHSGTTLEIELEGRSDTQG